MNKKVILKIMGHFPRKLKSEINKKRGAIPFIILVSFIISLLAARLWVITLKANETEIKESGTSVSKNVVISGYHIHHIAYGVILLIISGWMSINFWSRHIARLSAVLFGIGLGFIIDEVGFIIGGIEPYNKDVEVFYIAVFIITILLSALYFPRFYRTIREEIKSLYRRVKKVAEEVVDGSE